MRVALAICTMAIRLSHDIGGYLVGHQLQDLLVVILCRGLDIKFTVT